MAETKEFYKFYKEKLNAISFEPNITHIKLAELEKKGKLNAIITQNIDGLHQKAGSKVVYELHGNIHRNFCENCGRMFGLDYVMNSKDVPHCDGALCGGGGADCVYHGRPGHRHHHVHDGLCDDLCGKQVDPLSAHYAGAVSWRRHRLCAAAFH